MKEQTLDVLAEVILGAGLEEGWVTSEGIAAFLGRSRLSVARTLSALEHLGLIRKAGWVGHHAPSYEVTEAGLVLMGESDPALYSPEALIDRVTA